MMKKLFFFRSSSGKENSTAISQPSTNKQVHRAKLSGSITGNVNSPKGPACKPQQQVADMQGPGLRRSRSLSSANFVVDGLEERNVSSSDNLCRSPCSSACSGRHQKRNDKSRLRALTPEPPSAGRQYEAEDSQKRGMEGFGFAKAYHDSSGSSSSCSSNLSSTVVDRYIYGEEHLERSKQKNGSHRCSKLPPRVQCTAPTSPSGSAKDKRKAHSFREAKGTCLNFSSRDWVENGFVQESPRRLARSVIERLAQTHTRSSSKSSNCDVPITIEDVYGGSLDRSSKPNSDLGALNNIPLDEHYKCINEYHHTDDFSSYGQNVVQEDGPVFFKTEEDVELGRRAKEAKERVMLLSEELEQQRFLSDCGFNMPSLVMAIRKLAEERTSLAVEISDLLQSRIGERASAKEKIKLAKAELELHMRRLEKEKNELQAGLEKELDRRSSDWSFKLEKYQLEEKRLRERVRELAEQNVSLQREVSTFQERETDSRSMMMYSERKLDELAAALNESMEENKDLRQSVSELQERYNGAVEDLECIRNKFEEKNIECKELQKSITRLLRTCSEQEKTIEGLRDGLGDAMEKQPSEKFDHLLKKLQMEQMRLTGVELALRKEVESVRCEADSLRQENICLLNRLRGNGKEIEATSFKLESEMRSRVCTLQDQALPMLFESTQLCSKLLEFIKSKAFPFSETHRNIESSKGLDGQFIIECDIKVQGIRRGAESLTRSLQTISTLLHEKSSPVDLMSDSAITEANRSNKSNSKTLKESIKTELKAETLMTSLLREKLYSKELEVEQLQAELATAIRGNDILKREVQSTLDTLSCNNHKLKDLELQMLKKDEKINRLQVDLDEAMEELSNIKGTLQKVSAERDLIWEEVQQYGEKNMLLNSEVNLLKSKIDTLDEDILLKEGQITILKDTLGNQRLDLLASPDLSRDFLVQ